jgi:hypothetical protein
MSRMRQSSLLRRATEMTSAVTIAFVAFGGTAASASIDRKKINTFEYWRGGAVEPFGCPAMSTYGQTIRIPKGFTRLDEFTFAWKMLEPGHMVVRAEVYAWDGTKATGPSLFEKRLVIAYPVFPWHMEVFRPNGISVTPGAQYVLFASIDKDYEKCRNIRSQDAFFYWAYLNADHYAGGHFVYQNNEGAERDWTENPWAQDSAPYDLAFRVRLS